MDAVIPNWDLLHPTVRGAFMALSDDLSLAYAQRITATLFRPFELYRSPEKQAIAFKAKHSKAPPWSSPHQFGLAVDFVPRVNGRWSWEGPHDWGFLKIAAAKRGLESQGRALEWDKPHVQSPSGTLSARPYGLK